MAKPTALVACSCVVFALCTGIPGVVLGQSFHFIRGDCNSDGRQDLSDAIFHLGFNFLGTTAPRCQIACDANGDSRIDSVSDAVYLLQFLFLGRLPPPPPFPDCGPPRPEDALGCADPSCPTPELGAPDLDPLPPALTDQEAVTVRGTARGASSVQVDAPAGRSEVPVEAGSFTAKVPLERNRVNRAFFTSISAAGLRSAPTAVSITHDEEPPQVFIDFPPDGAELALERTDVAGRVGDRLSGFMGLEVEVNGVKAIVDVGAGTNGTFLAQGVPLAKGQSTPLVATARDFLLNTGMSDSITVRRVEIEPDAPEMAALRGKPLSGRVRELLPAPIAVVLTQRGNPFPNKVVTFCVTRSDGRLSAPGSAEESSSVQVRTDAAGLAQASWRLGSDAGCGNNRVAVTSRDIAGTVFFCASALPGEETHINVGLGNNQRGEAGSVLADPLRIYLHDGQNALAGREVEFAVTEGGGILFVDGAKDRAAAILRVATDDTGHALVRWTLGPEAGLQTLEADSEGNTGLPAVFLATALVRDAAQPTTLSGVVLDNSSRAIGGAEVRLQVAGKTFPAATGPDGRFAFAAIPGGPADLHVNGLEATLLAGEPLKPGSFPALESHLLLVPNAANALPGPVLLPPLDPNPVAYTGTEDAVLRISTIAGLEMRVLAGTRVNGKVPTPADPVTLSLNPVHFDEIPMPMPDGAAPPFAWTLQPAGATFDPPVEVKIPNMVGLPGGAIAYILIFDHDMNRFDIVATGSVTADGASIVSDRGSGIRVAGWGGFCPPYPCTDMKTDVPPPLPPPVPPPPPLPPFPPTPPFPPNPIDPPPPPAPPCPPLPNPVPFPPVTPSESYVRSYIGFEWRRNRGCCDLNEGAGRDFDAYRCCFWHLFFSARELLANAARLPQARIRAPSSSTELQDLAEFLWEGTRSLVQQQRCPSGAALSSIDKVSIVSSGEIDVPVLIPATFHQAGVRIEGVLAFPDDLTGLDGWLVRDASRFGFGPRSCALFAVTGIIRDPLDVDVVSAQIIVVDAHAGIFGTASAGGQTVPVRPDGCYTIPNVPVTRGTLSRPRITYTGDGFQEVFAPDVFLEGNIGGTTSYGFTPVEPPPLAAVSIAATVSPGLIRPAEEAQATVMATAIDASQVDITLRASGTTYQSSNPEVASVDEGGRVRGGIPGGAFITATNEGITSVAPVVVAETVVMTTLEGFVQLAGRGVADARVANTFGVSTTTNGAGFFSVAAAVPGDAPVIVFANAVVGGEALGAISEEIPAVPGGITDVGILTLRRVSAWNNVSSGDWNNAANWSTEAVPGPADDVVINVPSFDVTVMISAGDIAVNSLQSTERLVLAGGSLRVTTAMQVDNVLELRGGTLRETTVLAGVEEGSRVMVTGVATLSGVVMNANITLADRARLTVLNGLTLNATATLQSNLSSGSLGNSTGFDFPGTQTFEGTGEVVFAGAGSANMVRSSDETLTIGADLTICGGHGGVGAVAGGTGSFANLGTIRADASGRTITLAGFG